MVLNNTTKVQFSLPALLVTLVILLIVIFLCIRSNVVSADDKLAADNHYYNSLRAEVDGDYKKAIGELTQAIQIIPNRVRYYLDRAEFYFREADMDAALQDYNKVIAMATDIHTDFDSFGESRTALAYLRAGTIYYQRGDYQLAVNDCGKSLDIFPYELMAYECRGDAYRALQEFDKALADYKMEMNLSGKSSKYGAFYLTPDDEQRIYQKISDVEYRR